MNFNGESWIVYDSLGEPTFVLVTPTSSSCPFGIWYGADGQPISNTSIVTYACQDKCTCINLTVNEQGNVIEYTLILTGYDENTNPIYSDGSVTLSLSNVSNTRSIVADTLPDI